MELPGTAWPQAPSGLQDWVLAQLRLFDSRTLEARAIAVFHAEWERSGGAGSCVACLLAWVALSTGGEERRASFSLASALAGLVEHDAGIAAGCALEVLGSPRDDALVARFEAAERLVAQRNAREAVDAAIAERTGIQDGALH